MNSRLGKNITPRQLAIYASLSTSIFTAIILSISILFNFLQIKWLVFIIIILIIFAFSYWLTLYLVREFLYRKIKLVYKSIHKQKLSKQNKMELIDPDQDVFDDMEQEVVEWAADRESEIENLRSLEEYRRDFLGNISHELKTPLFNIQGYVHTLLDGAIYDENINLSYLRKAATNVERLQIIIEDLESISKLESGELALDRSAFDIRLLGLEVFQDLEMLAAEKNIKLNLKDGADSPFNVFADRENIRQVLVNLIVNSIKYGKENGDTKLAFYDMENQILIEVSDNGIGIEENHRKHVFDRFYRVDKSRSRDQGSSGLGLSIVKHIIEAHQQTINVRSALELGSTFGFTLEKVKS